MSRLHLKFRNFRPEIVAAASQLFDQKPWSVENDDQWTKIAQTFTDQVSNAYAVRSALVEISPSTRRRTRMRYEPAVMERSALSGGDELTEVAPPRIVLTGKSIIVLFKGVRTHALAQGDMEAVSQDDPWGWACSLFYVVKPAMFRARARERRIKGVTARDTYSSETWARMTEAGVTRGDWLAPGVDNFDARTLDSQVSEEDLEEFAASLGDADDPMDDLSDEGEQEEVDTEPVDPDLVGDEPNADDGERPSDWTEATVLRDQFADPADLFREDDELSDESEASDLPSVRDMNRDAVRALAAQWKVPGRGTLNRDELAAKLVELGRARP